MRKYLFICVGGFLGALSRYLLKALPIFEHSGGFPLSTLLINVIGSFLLCFLLTFALNASDFDPDLRLGLGTGFLGAFTTFSTLCKETIALLKSGNFSFAVLYIAASTALGLIAAYLGYMTALVLGKRHVLSTNETDDSLESDVDWMHYLLVGFGGALGAASRYLLGGIISRKTDSAFPLGTLIINVLGALLLGILVGSDAGANRYLLIGEGFLGAFTTFSTFMYESLNLSRGHKHAAAVLYMAGSLFLGILGFAAGFEIVIMLK